MKKTLGTLVCAATLICGAASAEAALLTEWNYTLNSVSLGNFNTGFATTDGTNASFDSGNYGIKLEAQAPDGTTEKLVFSGDNSSASDDEQNKLLNQTTENANGGDNTPATKIADLSFSYTVTSIENPGVFMDITYTIPLYTFYSAEDKTAYVYYNNSEVSTMGSTAITHDSYKYGITGVGLFVDGRALENFKGAEGDPNLYSGWAINSDTFNNNYSKYEVGGDNTGTYLGVKDVKGDYSITGILSITNTLIETPPAPTPEPATMLLMGLGLAGLGFVARRRSK